jgi:ABC-type multidrug transport system fused ATPase/permease subunit
MISRLQDLARPIFTDSAEMLLEQNTVKSSVGGLSIFSYFFLFFFYFVSSVMFYFLPLGFIAIVRVRPPLPLQPLIVNSVVFFLQEGSVIPWLSYISFGVIIASIIFDMFSKFHLAYASEHFAVQHKKRLFKKLMTTTLNFLKTTVISDIVLWFNVDAVTGKSCSLRVKPFTTNFFLVFQPHSIIFQSLIAAFCSIVLLVFANCWLIFLLVILLTGFGLICHKVRFTISHLYHKESESRQKFFMTVTNHLRCRIVIQSMDRVMEFCKLSDSLIEENTAAIFLRKSIKYHAQFLMNCLLGFGFSIVCLTVLLTPFSKLNPYRYILAVFSYYSLGYHLNRLLFDGILEVLVSNIKMEQMESSIQVSPFVA